MFGRQEKLKRLEAENKLEEALEKLSEVKRERDAFKVTNSRLVSAEQERDFLAKEFSEFKKKYVENEEAKAVVASLKIIKKVIFDDKPKAEEDSYSAYVAAQQAALRSINQYGNRHSSNLASSLGLVGLGGVFQK